MAVESERSKAVQWLNATVSEPYYMFPFIAFFSYFIVRTSAVQVLLPTISDHLLYREIQAVLAFSVLTSIKPGNGFCNLVHSSFLSIATDGERRSLGSVYWRNAVFRKGAWSKLTPLQLEALLTEGKGTRQDSGCLYFGIVDLGLFPNAAEKFGMYLGGGMNQLPTYILFENANGIARFPGLDLEAKASHPPITKRLISRYFELDRRLLDYVNSK